MEAEHYASHIASTWEDAEPVLGVEHASAIGYGMIERLHARGGAQALVVLRGLAAVAEQPIRDLAARLSDDPAAWGPDAPAWLSSVGSGQVVGAALLRTRVRADAPPCCSTSHGPAASAAVSGCLRPRPRRARQAHPGRAADRGVGRVHLRRATRL
jgi:hypothetical protein